MKITEITEILRQKLIKTNVEKKFEMFKYWELK